MLNRPWQSLSEGLGTRRHSHIVTLAESSGQDGHYVMTLPVLQAQKSILAVSQSQGCSEDLGL